MSLRRRVYEVLDPEHHDGMLSRAANYVIYTLIFLTVVAIVLESVPSISHRCSTVFWRFEVATVVVFSVEYVLRLWTCVESPRYAPPLLGRIRYVFSPLAVIDLLAVLPFYLPFITANMLFLRSFRFLRLFRVAKLGRYSSGFRVLAKVLSAKRAELVVSMSVIFILTIISAIGMYYAEHEAQPQVFPDIPSSMFWAIEALTNVGHPDPVTPIGRCMASLICVLGLAMLALPTGVLGAGFVEEFQSRNRYSVRCPHCGKDIGSHEGASLHADRA